MQNILALPTVSKLFANLNPWMATGLFLSLTITPFPAFSVNECGPFASTISCSGGKTDGIAYENLPTSFTLESGTVTNEGLTQTGQFGFGIAVISTGYSSVTTTGKIKIDIKKNVEIETHDNDVTGLVVRAPQAFGDAVDVTLQGSILTLGNRAHGAWITSTGNSALYSNSTVTTNGAGAHGLFTEASYDMNSGDVIQASSRGKSVTTNGNSSHAIYSKVVGNDLLTKESRAFSETSGIITTNGVASYGLYAEATGLGSITAQIISSGTITTHGTGSHALFSSSSNQASVTSSNKIETHGDNAYAAYALSNGLKHAIVFAKGEVITHGIGAYGATAESLNTASTATTLVDLSDATLTTNGNGAIASRTIGNNVQIVSNSAVVGGISTSSGIHTYGEDAQAFYLETHEFGTKGSVTVSLKNTTLETDGRGSHGLHVNQLNMTADRVNLTLSSSFFLTRAQDTHGIYLVNNDTTGENTVNLTDSTIVTNGDRSNGIRVNSTSVAGESLITLRSSSIKTDSSESSAIHIDDIDKIDVRVQNGSELAAVGAYSSGLRALSTSNGALTLNIEKTSSVSGGWQPTTTGAGELSSGILAGTNGGLITVIVNGTLGAYSDRAIADMENHGISGTSDWVIHNTGVITGFGDLGGGTDNIISSGTFNLRHYAAEDASGNRAIKRVATFDMGGGDNAFGHSGTLNLTSISSFSSFDDAGAYVPTGLNAANYNMANAGVEQGHILNVKTFRSSGTINMQDEVTGDVLLISGGSTPGNNGGGVFLSNGGRLLLDVYLDQGGANSKSDVLVVDSTQKGISPTLLSFKNISPNPGTATVDKGILVVEVLDPDASDPTVFSQLTMFLSGTYQYNLVHGGAGDGNWYLQRGGQAPTVDTYANYPSAVSQLGKDLVGTLHQRMGERLQMGFSGPFSLAFSSAAKKTQTINQAGFAQGLQAANWILKDDNDDRKPIQKASFSGGDTPLYNRLFSFTKDDYIVDAQMIMRDGHYNGQSSAGYDQNAIYMQMNLDRLLYQSDDNRIVGGVIGTFGRTHTKMANDFAKINTKNQAIGGSLTWFNHQGYYVDLTGHYNFYQSNIKATDELLGELAKSNGRGFAVSSEVGVNNDMGGGWMWVPQAQLVYSRSSFDPIADITQSTVNIEDSRSVLGRVGVAFRHTNLWTDAENGKTNGFQTNLVVDIRNEFAGEAHVNDTGLDVTYKPHRAWIAFKGGGTYAWGQSHGLYGAIGYSSALNDFGRSQEVYGHAGVRWKF